MEPIESPQPMTAQAAPLEAPPGQAGQRFDQLNLDLEIFQGPFDLLLELVMREEVDLLEVDLAEIVLAYIDLLEQRGEIELEPVTEFVVLIAALLELKSRLMLPRAEGEELGLDLAAEEAADELLARMLEYHRFKALAGWMHERFTDESGYMYRGVAPPKQLRRVALETLDSVYLPERLAAAIGDLLLEPPPLETPHMAKPRVTLSERLQTIRSLLRNAISFDFDQAVEGADRQTECMTLWALLELYKLGEASWNQEASFGPIQVVRAESEHDASRLPGVDERGAEYPSAPVWAGPSILGRRDDDEDADRDAIIFDQIDEDGSEINEINVYRNPGKVRDE